MGRRRTRGGKAAEPLCEHMLMPACSQAYRHTRLLNGAREKFSTVINLVCAVNAHALPLLTGHCRTRFWRGVQTSNEARGSGCTDIVARMIGPHLYMYVHACFAGNLQAISSPSVAEIVLVVGFRAPRWCIRTDWTTIDSSRPCPEGSPAARCHA